MIIAFVNTKGGVGKTTSAVLVGCAASQAGYQVDLWDADPQGSATLWAEMAKENGEELPFPVRVVNAALLSRAQSGGNLVIIDTPPGDAQIVQTAIDKADLVVIPTQASGLDLQRVWPTLNSCEHRMRAVLLTSVDAHTLAHKATLELLAEADQPVFSTTIPKRQGLRAEFGQNPSQLWGYDILWTEIEEAIK